MNPDIICLEEVDQPEFFSEFLKENYQIFWKPKDNTDGLYIAINL